MGTVYPDGRLVNRSGDEHDDILILKAGHSPDDYGFTKTGLVLPTALALYLSR